MNEPTVNTQSVKQLRELTGCGMIEAKNALIECKGDMLLAQGYLKYKGLAVYIRPKPHQTPEQAYEEWVWSQARAFKSEALSKMQFLPLIKS